MKFVSVKGDSPKVDFETAILNGFAPDGGLYVPEQLPKISLETLQTWKSLSYRELVFEITSLFIPEKIIPTPDLKQIIKTAYDTFEKEETIPLHPLKNKPNTYIMELFYGPTLSFKDVGLAFLVNVVNYFLQRKDEKQTVVVATTGDTGPAAAYYAAGKSNLDAWTLYPKGMITPEQERQMTTLPHPNIHPVGVWNCPEGGDDLDAVIKQLYAHKAFKEKLHLTSVNSINWGRIMVQSVHYFYGYLQLAEELGEPIHFCVPSGGFGNLCAGSLARLMGLPVEFLVIGNNKNACLHRIFSSGEFSKAPIHETASSAIDILIPLNFWRYLYFATDKNPAQMKEWISTFEQTGMLQFDEATYQAYAKGFLSTSISDEETLETIKTLYESEDYLLDPHSAVAVCTANKLADKLGDGKILCLATAHPAKFPDIIKKALHCEDLPEQARHHSIELAKRRCEKVYLCEQEHLEEALMHAMESNWDFNNETEYNNTMQYTTLAENSINNIFEQYEIGEVVEYEAMGGGSENTNYYIKTEQEAYVLTICEQKSEAEALNLAQLLAHLNEHGFETSQVVPTKAGVQTAQFEEKPILLKTFINGGITPNFSNVQMETIGKHLANLHQIAAPEFVPQQLGYGVGEFAKIQTHAPDSKFCQWLMKTQSYIEEHLHEDLPKALIHSDLFYNNIITDPDTGQLTIMDFEEAAYYYRVYDIGMTLVGTCTFGTKLRLRKARYFLKGYQQHTPLSDAEKNALQAFTVYAATATAFWRYMQFNIVRPNEENKYRYKEMQATAMNIMEISAEDFQAIL